MSAVYACDTTDLEPGEALGVEIPQGDDIVDVAVVRADDGRFFAIADVCSHGEVPLSDGDVEGCTIECWLHGSRFDLLTGAPLELPATEPVKTYPVTVDGERVLVDIDA